MNKKNKDQKNCKEENGTIDDLRALTATQILEMIQEHTLHFVRKAMEDEVKELCGLAFAHKKDGQAHRAGSDPGSISFNGKKIPVRKPRVRNNGSEVQLNTYNKLHSQADLADRIFHYMLQGISSRSYGDLVREVSDEFGISKSSVSRHFIRHSRESLNDLNQRTFSDKIFWALMVDGIHVCGEVLVVTLGIDTNGEKHFLSLSQGSSENSEVVDSCLRDLRHRNIKFTGQVLAITDGAKALKSSLVKFFGGKVDIQRCYNHKLRNIESKLGKKHHSEFKDRYRRAYNCNSYEDAQSEFNHLEKWLGSKSHEAAKSLSEGLPDLLTLHRIGLPPELRKSFYTTNLIESSFSSPRARSNRVKRWRNETDMVQRWMGSLLVHQESQFRKVRNYSAIPDFLKQYVKFGKYVDKTEDSIAV